MILLSMFLTRKPAKRLLDTPINWITEHKRISEMLDAAVVQRCKVRVSFHRSMGVGRSTDGTLLDSGKNGLTLEIPSLKVINQKWIGRTLDLSMRMKMPDQPQLQSNVGFVSDITGFEQPRDDITVLKLSLPIRLELDQNRQHLRVEPPEKYVRSFMIWTEEAVRKRAGKLQDPESWGPPTFLSVAAGQQELELENLSGGGLRVRIEPQALRKKKCQAGPARQPDLLSDPDRHRGHHHDHLLSHVPSGEVFRRLRLTDRTFAGALVHGSRANPAAPPHRTPLENGGARLRLV